MRLRSIGGQGSADAAPVTRGRAPVGVERSPRLRDGGYVSHVAKNIETARVAWGPQPERVRLGDIWARSLHEIYYRRMSDADALRRASNEVDRVLKEADIVRR